MPVLQAPTAELTEAIWRDYHARLSAFVARRVSDPSDVDDIVQEVADYVVSAAIKAVKPNL